MVPHSLHKTVIHHGIGIIIRFMLARFGSIPHFQVEEIIYRFPGILEAAVIGVEDKLRGQAGACFYSMHEGQSLDLRALKKFLQQNLALYKIPREFHELKELPRTSTGKIAKREIMKIYLEKKASQKKSD